MPSNTILDIALSNPDINGDGNGDFNILGTALGLFPDLVSAAGNPDAAFTVFAPSDQAFLNLANAVDPSVGGDENQAVETLASASALLSPSDDPTAFLKSILTYHTVGEPLTGAEVASADSILTLSGENIRPDELTLRDKDRDFADPNVTNPDGSENGIVADNGILHVIDNVLLPFDITFSDGGFVFVGRGPDAVVGSNDGDVVFLGRGNDIANGLDGDDLIFGGRGDDLAIGGDGEDSLFGGRGSDTLEGGADDDQLNGARGGDSLDGGDGEDNVLGGRGGDTLEGGADDDYVNGGRGRDMLTGEEGDDILVGGRSGDRFVFSPFREGEGNDVVVDFDPRVDTLVLDLTAGDPDLLAAIAAEGEPGLQFTDLLTFDTDAHADGVQAPVSLGASHDGDLLITHLTGTIELDRIPSDVDPNTLIPAIDFLTPADDSALV